MERRSTLLRVVVLLNIGVGVLGFAPRTHHAEVRLDGRRAPQLHTPWKRSAPLHSASSSDYVPKEKKKIVPKIGDIVTFEGKWKDESGLGRLATLQYIADRGQWIADVVIYKEIETGLYRETKRGRSSEYMDVISLKPVLASYVRAVDGWRVPVDKKTGLVKPAAEAYIIDESFKLPDPVVDEDKYQQYLEEYEELKWRLLRETLLFGAAGTLATAVTQGREDGAVFAVGVLVGAGYLLLLEQQADKLGRETPSGQGGGIVGRLFGGGVDISGTRFLLPVFLVLGLAARQYATGFQGFDYDAPPQTFNVVPKDQFVSAVLGFLSYRVPLLYTELKGAFTGGIADSLVEVLPGSLAKTVQVVNQYNENKPGPSMDSSANAALVGDGRAKVLLVSGPPATGKTSLVTRLLGTQQPLAGRLQRPPIATTRPPRAGEEEEGRFVFLDRLAFAQLQREGQLVASWTSEDAAAGGSEAGLEVLCSTTMSQSSADSEGMGNGAGVAELYGLRVADVLAAGSGGGVCVLDTKDTDAADAVATALEDRSDVSLTGMWVSLDNLADFEARLKKINPALAAEDGDGPAELRSELKKVINAIEFGVMSGLFEFTIINDDSAVAAQEMSKSIKLLLGESDDDDDDDDAGEVEGK